MDPESWFAAVRTQDVVTLTRHATIGASFRDASGLTGLMLASRENLLKSLKALARTEARLTAAEGYTALLIAATVGNHGACEILLPLEGDLVLDDGRSALSLAAGGDHSICVTVLHAQWRTQDIYGRTALDHTVYASAYHAAEAYIKYCDPDMDQRDFLGFLVKDIEGAQRLAQEQENETMYRFLDYAKQVVRTEPHYQHRGLYAEFQVAELRKEKRDLVERVCELKVIDETRVKLVDDLYAELAEVRSELARKVDPNKDRSVSRRQKDAEIMALKRKVEEYERELQVLRNRLATLETTTIDHGSLLHPSTGLNETHSLTSSTIVPAHPGLARRFSNICPPCPGTHDACIGTTTPQSIEHFEDAIPVPREPVSPARSQFRSLSNQPRCTQYRGESPVHRCISVAPMTSYQTRIVEQEGIISALKEALRATLTPQTPYFAPTTADSHFLMDSPSDGYGKDTSYTPRSNQPSNVNAGFSRSHTASPRRGRSNLPPPRIDSSYEKTPEAVRTSPQIPPLPSLQPSPEALDRSPGHIDIERLVSTDKNSYSRLMRAILQKNRTSIISLLSEAHQTSHLGVTALMLACKVRDCESARMLKPWGVRKHMACGYTALMESCKYGYTELVELLTAEAGMQTLESFQWGAGVTALMIACYYGHPSCVSLLLKLEATLVTASGLRAEHFCRSSECAAILGTAPSSLKLDPLHSLF
ncbi:Ankyrin repeat protein 1 [Giardia muris]|uniref:Ankyrin repeat protein 1 n=1 Tax=Giardia muris TaxID=5742 RepID=A0A4Z1SSX4_GIAMU|nr:Ankyrin repeat protein 1 [Giardia muris]|eukprot:TNJ28860.1 Ankyrin repeat protein 1 [Giardia muris]